MSIVIIAWNGDMKQGFYAVPVGTEQRFLDRFRSDKAPWEIVETGPLAYYLDMKNL